MKLSAALEQALNAERDPACVIEPTGTIVFLNQAWDAHVVPPGTERATAAWLSGKAWLDSISGVTRSFYRLLLEAALGLPATEGAGLVHLCECNTGGLVRRSTSRFTPLYEAGVVTAVVILHGLSPLGTPEEVYGARPRELAELRDSRGALIQCSCCRRLLDVSSGKWEFVPAALERPEPSTTQAVCATCEATYLVAPKKVPSRWPS